MPALQTIGAEDGWADNNKLLFDEWKVYYEKVVLASNGDLLPEDAGALVVEEKRRLDEAQANITAAIQAEAAAAPVAKPGGVPSQGNRFNPMGKDSQDTVKAGDRAP